MHLLAITTARKKQPALRLAQVEWWLPTLAFHLMNPPKRIADNAIASRLQRRFIPILLRFELPSVILYRSTSKPLAGNLPVWSQSQMQDTLRDNRRRSSVARQSSASIPTGQVWAHLRHSYDYRQDASALARLMEVCRDEVNKTTQEVPDSGVFADEGVRCWMKSRPALDRRKAVIESKAALCTDTYFLDSFFLSRYLGIAADLRRFLDLHVHYVADDRLSGTKYHKLTHTLKALVDDAICDNLDRNVIRGLVHQFENGYLCTFLIATLHGSQSPPGEAAALQCQTKISQVKKVFQVAVPKTVCTLVSRTIGCTERLTNMTLIQELSSRTTF